MLVVLYDGMKRSTAQLTASESLEKEALTVVREVAGEVLFGLAFLGELRPMRLSESNDCSNHTGVISFLSLVQNV